jgi:hypothetical protein
MAFSTSSAVALLARSGSSRPMMYSALISLTIPDESFRCTVKQAGSSSPSLDSPFVATRRNSSLCAALPSSVNRRVAGSSPAAGANPRRKWENARIRVERGRRLPVRGSHHADHGLRTGHHLHLRAGHDDPLDEEPQLVRATPCFAASSRQCKSRRAGGSTCVAGAGPADGACYRNSARRMRGLGTDDPLAFAPAHLRRTTAQAGSVATTRRRTCGAPRGMGTEVTRIKIEVRDWDHRIGRAAVSPKRPFTRTSP